MNEAKHEDFRVGKFVSLWLGNFEAEDDLDEYLIEQFANDFGFEIYEFDGPEGDVSEDGPKPIRQLLEGFSHWDSFVEAAEAQAHSRGWTQATTALVFYNFKYDSQFINSQASGPLTFIGCLPYSASHRHDEV